MRRQLFVVLMLLAAVCGPAKLYSQEIVKSEILERIDGKEYYIHTVEQGQTLYSLSKVYDVPVDELVFENPDAKSGLAIGQLLRIPVVSREKKITNELRKGEFRFIFHIVGKGESLFAISRIYDVSVNDLKEANPEWSEGLKPGQYLKIPLKDPVVQKRGSEIPGPDAESKVHTVTAGETLYSISRKYKIGIPELKAANPGITTSLDIGRKIIIPSAMDLAGVPQDEKKYIEHIVIAKETLYSIARKYRISVDSLMAFNTGLTKDIYPGEVIRIPAIINPDSFITHRVSEKTKLKRVAGKYAVSVTAMKDANPGFRSRLRPGDVLYIPVGPPSSAEADDVTVVVTEPDDIPPAVIKKDSIRCYDMMKRNKRELKIALMLPLYSEEVREIDIPRNAASIDPDDYKSFNFIQFYEGFLMAMDELEEQGLKVKLYVYDVDEKVSKTIQVLQQPELPDMDLIIGPFYSRNFKLVSNFAELFGIKIVNPLTRRTEVLSSPNVYKMKPSRDAQPALLTSFVEKYYPESNIILIRNNKFQFANEIEIIKSSLDKLVPFGVKIPNSKLYDLILEYSKSNTILARGMLMSSLQVENRKIHTAQLENAPGDSTFFSNGIAEITYATDSVHGILQHASIARHNLLIVLTNNEIFAPEILTSLNDLKDTFDITVIGMPEWERFTNLETDYLLDLKVYFFTDSYYDYNDPDVENFVRGFRERFNTDPGRFGFEGYDLATYFLGAMMRFGPDCEDCLPYYPKELLKTSVKFAPAYPAGYENLYWNLCRYHNYKIVKVPDL